MSNSFERDNTEVDSEYIGMAMRGESVLCAMENTDHTDQLARQQS